MGMMLIVVSQALTVITDTHENTSSGYCSSPKAYKILGKQRATEKDFFPQYEYNAQPHVEIIFPFKFFCPIGALEQYYQRH